MLSDVCSIKTFEEFFSPTKLSFLAMFQHHIRECVVFERFFQFVNVFIALYCVNAKTVLYLYFIHAKNAKSYMMLAASLFVLNSITVN